VTEHTVDRKKYPHEHNDCYVSDLMVCQSAAGYYLGRMCLDKEDGFEEPYSRESDYFASKEKAAAALAAGFEVRNCIENQYAYETGNLPPPHQPKDN